MSSLSEEGHTTIVVSDTKTFTSHPSLTRRSTLTLFSSCALTSLSTFLVLGLAIVLQREKQTLTMAYYATKKMSWQCSNFT